jgi:hypothetical protein
LKAAEIPHYKGAEETQTPYDFLIELDKYKSVSRSSDDFMINEIAPLALQGQAFHWYRFESSYAPFIDYEDFKVRFRKEFQPLGYAPELSRELELRTQGPTESLTVFIRVIVDYYKRLGQNPSDAELVSRIKRQMHPEYMQALQGKVITTLRELMNAAFDAQEVIKAFRAYRPPPIAPGVEPSLQWKPMDSSHYQSNNHVSTFTSLPDRASAILHPHAIDPYTFFHAESQPATSQTFQRKTVAFSDNQNQRNNNSDFRSNNQNQRNNSDFQSNNQNQRNNNDFRSNNQTFQNNRPNNDFRPSSPITSTPRPSTPVAARPSTPTTRACYNCGNPDHLLPACPLPRNSPRLPGNSLPPSPARK